MKLSRFTLLYWLFATFALALPVFAQESTPEATTEIAHRTFVAEDGAAAVNIPPDWVLKNNVSSNSIISLKLGNSESALAKDLFNRDDVFNPGEVHIEFELIEVAELVKTLPEGTITIESTPLEIVQVLAEQGLPDTFTFGDPGELTINDHPAVRMNLTSKDHGEGQLLFTIYNKKWLAGILLFAAPGEGDKWDTIARDIVGSVSFDVEPQATPEAPNLPTIESTVEPLALTQTAKTQNGLGSLAYPDTWFVRQFGAESIYVSNTETALEKSFGSALESGQVNILFSISSTADYIKQAELPVEADATPLELLQVTIKAVEDGVKFGTPEATTVGDRLAARVDFSADGFEGTAWLIEAQKGVIVAVQMLAAPGEALNWESITLDIAESVSSAD